MNTNAFEDICNVLSVEYLEKRRLARTHFKYFIKYIKGENYDMTSFHEAVAEDINDFIEDQYNRMMLFAPPQHGKSEQSSRLAPAYIMGRNPKVKMVIVCYAKVIAEGFSDDVQKIIESQKYRELFPEVIIDGVGCKKGTLKRNSYIFQTSEEGYLISVGVGGPLTSKTVDIAIIDDVYKGPIDSGSKAHREKVEKWYWSVLESRLHNYSKVMILYTRWHKDDLAGSIIKQESELWHQIKYEVLKTNATKDNIRDHRVPGEVLWPAKHNKEKILRWKKMDPVGFGALGQQNPKPAEGSMYFTHRTYKELPDFSLLDLFNVRKVQIDTADTGEDYLAAVAYIECNGLCYVTDIYYTQEPMTVTEPKTAEMIKDNQTQMVSVESNNGGSNFARAVEKEAKAINYDEAYFDWYSQSDNKESKIFAYSAKVMNRVIFPNDWKDRWPEAYEHFTSYLRAGKNDHDDFPDVLSEMMKNLDTDPDDDSDDVMII